MTNNVWIRKRILELAHNAGSNGSHIGGSLSLVEILNALYSHNLNLDTYNINRDRIILSKGHGALALYCMLEMKGIISHEFAETFETNGTTLFAHAKRDVVKGIEFSGGSLGLGLSFAVGVALACRSNGQNNHIYVILGDGECDEGLVWESVMSASHYKLDNLTLIVDCNGLQSDGYSKDIMNTDSLESKFSAFGCTVLSVNGHSERDITKALTAEHNGRPKVLVAYTLKGKGVSFLENKQSSHHLVLNDEQYKIAIMEVEND